TAVRGFHEGASDGDRPQRAGRACVATSHGFRGVPGMESVHPTDPRRVASRLPPRGPAPGIRDERDDVPTDSEKGRAEPGTSMAWASGHPGTLRWRTHL